MSEQTAEAAATETEASTEQQETEKQKPTETVDFWKAKAREQEKRAKENADAAKRLAEIEESQKSEAEKTADRIKQLETEAENARRDALRFKVASEFGIASERAELLLTGSDEETMRRQAEALKGESDQRKKQGNRVPNEGTTSTATGNADAQFASNLLGGGD
jgi:hypothetical protein